MQLEFLLYKKRADTKSALFPSIIYDASYALLFVAL
ncbi:hypothetical protein protein [Bacillus cereus G9241]|nr:hypothetical protein protein [Bacillus cereus G9241]